MGLGVSADAATGSPLKANVSEVNSAETKLEPNQGRCLE